MLPIISPRSTLFSLSGGGSLSVDALGAAGDGTTDDYAIIQAAINTLMAGNGGVLVFGPKTYKIGTALVLPNGNAVSGVPRQKPLKLQGAGPHWSGRGTALLGCTVLDMRSADALGRIQSYGLGYLEIEGLVLTNLGTSNSNPVLFATNTSCHVHGNAFLGASGRTGTNCDEDAMVFGGATSTTIDGSSTSPFQGYMTRVEGNYFGSIRRAVYGRKYFNANVIRENTVWNTSGSGLAGGACIELDGGTPDFTVGNVIVSNLIEMGNYVYPIKITTGQNNIIAFNGLYDPNVANNLAGVYLASDCTRNLVIGSTGPSAISKPYYLDAGAAANANKYISVTQGEQSLLGPAKFASDGSAVPEFSYALFSGQGGPNVVIQPAATLTDSAALFQILRSAAEATNPSANILKVAQNGAITWSGTSQGSITTDLASAMSWSASGRTWAANGSGGNITINSGSGGSFNDHKGFSHRFFDHTSAFGLAITGAGVLKWGTSSTVFDTGLARNAAGVVEVNSGTAGTFRDLKARNLIASGGVIQDASYTISTLPAAGGTTGPAGSRAYASNGRKSGEGAAGGTGIPVWCDGTNWRTHYDNSVAAA